MPVIFMALWGGGGSVNRSDLTDNIQINSCVLGWLVLGRNGFSDRMLTLLKLSMGEWTNSLTERSDIPKKSSLC